MDLYRGHFDISSLQPPYSLLNRTIETRELPYCLQHNIGVINYSPLFRGLLGGRYHAGSVIDGARASGPFFHGEGLRLITEAVDQAKEIAASLDLTVAQLALRWTLTNPAITSAIVGVKKPDHILGALKAADDVLSQSDWHRVANLFAKAVAEVE
jgi:aryl-alcohol dehydrogenase-like predicted oxidoreductase